jgi:hypothetical protein
VRLAEVEGGTELSYDVEAKIGGKIAQLGSRIIDGVARKLADEFFTKFQSVVEGPAEESGAVEEGATEAEVKKGWLKRTFGG